MISQRFLNNPNEEIDAYKEVLIGWLGNGLIANPNRYGRILFSTDDGGVALRYKQ